MSIATAILLALLVWSPGLPAWAAIVATNLTANFSSADATSYATASITPTTSSCVILSVHSRIAVGVSGGPVTPTASGNGLTWVQVSTQVTFGATPNRRSTIFRAMGTPSAGVVTIAFGAETQTHASWSISEFAGVATTGTHCSGAVVQSGSANDGGVTGTTSTVTLGAAPSRATNMTVASSVVTANLTSSVGSGFTLLSHNSETTDGTSHLNEYKSNTQTATATWTGSNSWLIIALELQEPTCTGSLLLMGAGGC